MRFSAVPRSLVASCSSAFGLNDCAVLFKGDRAFFSEHRFGPEQFWENGFEKPFHPEGVVMDAPKVHVGRNFAVGQHFVEMLWAGLDNLEPADGVEFFVL